MTFATAFREHVTPALRKLARTQGLFLALGRRSFIDAFDEVWQIAVQRGALHLPDHTLLDLEAWVAIEIVTHCQEFEPSVNERRLIADRVAADIARCEALWAATTE